MEKKILEIILKFSGIELYDIADDTMPHGDSKVVFDNIDGIWFVININERGVIKFINMYDSIYVLCRDLLAHKIHVRY